MPKQIPIPLETRRRIAGHLAITGKRNATARHFGVSTGVVTKIAREFAIYLSGAEHTHTATHARQIDLWAARIAKLEKLEAEFNEAQMNRAMSGSPLPSTKERRISYALYNTDRHHNGQYRA
jgi:hypothetical protein